jgi:triosephosphate isomerase
MHAFIRSCLLAHLGAEGANVRILYGGSVDADNAHAILALEHVCGALVGGASLRAIDFEAVIRGAALT